VHKGYPEEVHVAEVKAAKKGDHMLHEGAFRATNECQPSLQRGCGGWDERCVSCALLFTDGKVVLKLEVLEVREKTDEIQELSTRAFGLFKGKELKSGWQVSKVPLNVGHEAGYLKVIYPEFLEVCEGGKVTQGTSAELFRAKPVAEW
jgi:hypothetical protein